MLGWSVRDRYLSRIASPPLNIVCECSRLEHIPVFPWDDGGTFAFYKFLALWRGTTIVLKIKVIYLKFFR